MLLALVPLSCLVFGYTSSLELPSYLKQCSLSDKNLNECIKNHGNDALATVLKGDRKYRIQNLSPVVVPEVTLGIGGNFVLKMQNATADLANAHVYVQDVRFDVENKHMFFHLVLDSLTILGKYDINGQILVLPINGNGDINMTYTQPHFFYDMDLTEKDIKGETHYAIKDSKLDFNVTRGYFDMTNLFNGNAQLGTDMNKFINENWMDFLGEIKPAAVKILDKIMSSVFAGYFGKVPENNIFSE